MKSSISFFVVLSLAFTVGICQKLPSFFKPCSLKDSRLTKCLTEAAQSGLIPLKNGYPDINLPSMDPLKVENIKLNQPSLKVQFENAKIYGLSACKINELSIDQSKNKIYFNYTKDGYFQAKYQIDGRILIIPIKGEGECKIKFTNLNYYFVMDYEVVKGNDGKDHWKISKHQVSYEADKVNFKFTNLFNGNKQLADTAHRVVNDNGLIVFQDLSPPIMSKVSKSMVSYINKFLENVPLEELFLP